MNRIIKFVLFSVATVFIVTSCSRGLRVLVYNNSGQAVTLGFKSGDDAIAKELEVGEKTIFPYGDISLPAEISISTNNCEFSYALSAPYGNYGNAIPKPLDKGPYRIDLQIQNDLQFYFVPSGAELPLTESELPEQPEPFFPIKPTAKSCANE